MRIFIAPVAFLAAVFFHVASAEDFEKPKEIGPLNEAIATGAAAGETWIKDPTLIAGKLTGSWLGSQPDSEPASQSRQVVGMIEGEAGAAGKVAVVVKEIGLFDDAVRRIDHTYEFSLKDGTWTVISAKLKAHDARPPYPAYAENLKQRKAGTLLCLNSTGAELAELAQANGIENFSALVSDAIGGDRESLIKVLKLAKLTDGAAAEIYAELAFGLSCLFERTTFQRMLYFDLEEDEREAVQEYIEWIETDVVPD